jgi:hypothetical protein
MCSQEPTRGPCVTFRNMMVFTLELLAPLPNLQDGRPTFVYLLYPKLPCVGTSGGLLLHPQLEDAPCHGDMVHS